VCSNAFIEAAGQSNGLVAQALKQGAKVLSDNGEQWSRQVEEALYEGYQASYPLNLKR
jgi:hypothetical protein